MTQEIECGQIMEISSLFLPLLLLLAVISNRATASNGSVEITYGSAVKLKNEKTEFRLHSHGLPYGSGSGQQSVTGYPKIDDSNSYWIIRPLPEQSVRNDDVIKTGTSVRLQHMTSRGWLHSHMYASPLSENIEVSCFGGDDDSDTGDYWQVEIEGEERKWKKEQRIRLRHIDTNSYLHGHTKKYSGVAEGQQEVCGISEKRPGNVWLAAEGVYLPVNVEEV